MLGEGLGMRVDGQLVILCLERRILRFNTVTTTSARRKVLLGLHKLRHTNFIDTVYFAMRYFLHALLLLLTTTIAYAQEGQLKLDSDSLKASQAQLSQTIQAAVQNANGSWETNAVHWVLAFKTGFFKDDPVRASAAREVASKLIQNLAVAGDRVSARAFEFGLWEYKSATDTTLSISSSAVSDMAKTDRVLELFPLTPKAGSLGGHDLERTAVELGNEFSQDSDTVIVMLLNSAASQGAPGEKLIGSNAPKYQALLEKWQRLSGTKNGATLEMPFKVIQPNNAVPTEAKLEVVVFVPKTFSGVSLSGGTRSELLAAAGTNPNTTTPSGGSGSFPIWLLLIPLAIGAFFVARTLGGSGNNSSWLLEITETSPASFRLSDTKNNGTVALVVGTGYSNDGGEPIAIHPKAPQANKLVRFVRVGNNLKIDGTGGSLELKTLDGDTVLGSTTVKPDLAGVDHTLEFQGEVINSTGIPRNTIVTLRFRLVKG
jgi:hypothetical protein